MSPPALARQSSKVVFPTLCLLALIGQVGSFLYLPALPTIAAELVTDERGIQGTVVAFLFGTLLGFALYGPLSDRFGSAAMLAVAGVLFVAGSAGSGLAADLTTLVAARFVQGVGSVAGIITARTAIRDLYPPAEAVRLVSFLSAANATSVAASPIVGAFLLTMISWRAGFWATALVAAAATAAGIIILPNSGRRGTRETLKGIGDVLASPVWRSCLLITGGTTAAFMVIMAASPFVFITTFGADPVTYGWTMAFILGSFGVVAALTARMAGQLGAKRVMRLAVGPMMLGALAVALVTVWLPGHWALAAAMMVLIGPMGIMVPSAHMAMLTPFPKLGGSAASLGLLVATSSGALAVWIYAGVLAGSVARFGLAIAVLAGIAAIGWVLLPAEDGDR